MSPIEALDALAKTPSEASATIRVRALGHCLDALHASNDAHLFSIFAGEATNWGSPELEGLPPARRWLPLDDDQGYPRLFFDSDLALAQRTGAAIDRAASFTDIPPKALNRIQGNAQEISGRTLSETLIDALTNEWPSTRLCELFWKDQQLGSPARAIYGLSLESDNFLVFVGPGDLGEPCVVILGEQPFESILYSRSTPKSGANEALPETAEAFGHVIEAKSTLPPIWWDDLVRSGIHTLLRATFMQMAIPGEPLDITSPDKTPRWRDVPMLGQ